VLEEISILTYATRLIHVGGLAGIILINRRATATSGMDRSMMLVAWPPLQQVRPDYLLWEKTCELRHLRGHYTGVRNGARWPSSDKIWTGRSGST
jgi:hypothetical protein